MDQYNNIKFAVFTSISQVANSLQNVMDLGMKEITSKQWLPLVIIGRSKEPPTLNELAEKCGITRQSTKQLVDKLVEQDFAMIKRDELDKRSIRIILTLKGKEWSKNNYSRNHKFVECVFNEISDEELKTFYEVQKKILNKLQIIKSDFQKGEEE